MVFRAFYSRQSNEKGIQLSHVSWDLGQLFEQASENEARALSQFNLLV